MEVSGTAEVKQLALTVEVMGEDEPNTLFDEVREEVNTRKISKAPGFIYIETELWQAYAENGIKAVCQLCSVIWQGCKCPTEWCKSVLIPLHKKRVARLGSDYNKKTVSISHGSKAMLQIQSNLIKVYLHRQIPTEQVGFMPGRATKKQIINVGKIFEKCIELSIVVVIRCVS